ncbi:hypothetical protein JQX13_04790 [Archangium violaceum]|uniref:hypothetical protein n=1 Tax=Archangium violaceum TaxID=83451 RepID=UPI00193B9024|nr:hypothetical protein [Archangium violaceum]QRK09461.1 hypothetical protein JQX13_04790 [Archangium violaceum]
MLETSEVTKEMPFCISSSLRSVGGSIRIVNNAYLETQRDVRDNAKLSTFELDRLTRVGQSFTVENNPLLPTCLVNARAAPFIGTHVQVTIAGNDDTAACGG